MMDGTSKGRTSTSPFSFPRFASVKHFADHSLPPHTGGLAYFIPHGVSRNMYVLCRILSCVFCTMHARSGFVTWTLDSQVDVTEIDM